jgi:hypothetical protein
LIRLFDPTENTIFLDMDGVVADFDRFVIEELGRPSDANADDPGLWEALKPYPHFFSVLQPTPYAFELWEQANLLGSDVVFLTAVPRTMKFEHAEEDKIAWAKKYFGDDVVVRFGPYAHDKWQHAYAGDILVDDRTSNVKDWINKAGGIGILHSGADHQDTIDRLKRFATEIYSPYYRGLPIFTSPQFDGTESLKTKYS